ncbi:CRISPR-associated DxTHG motif protein [Thiohalorhabdus methylotrophus]|uniref:CRISPR-associated DxTHG motif protein n=1 Tax=Thiohalorhabdus methylotrophus TaxID=3242694 RepID=A0ABV4TQF8_9GAMM
MPCRALPAVLALLLLVPAPPSRGAEWHFTAQLGEAWATSERLRFRHADGRTTRFTLEPETRGLTRPYYWSMRLGRFQGGAGWEFELIHDKVFASAPPAAIDHLDITHGFNHLFLNRAWRLQGFTTRVGVGAVLAHPTIRADGRTDVPSRPGFLEGTSLEGQQLSGVTGQAAIQKLFPLGGGVAISLEAKASLSVADVEGAGGSMRVPRKAVHLLGGLRFSP